MDQNQLLGMRIRELRSQKGFSVEEMAAFLGVDPETYSAYENGEKRASFSFYYNLAERFGLDVSSIINGETPNLSRFSVTRKGEGFPPVRRPDYTYLHQAIHMKDRIGEPFLVTAPFRSNDELLQYSKHSGQEYMYIVDGSLRVSIEGSEQVLHTGDSMYFDGRLPHAMSAIDRPCTFISIVMHRENEEDVPDHFAAYAEKPVLPQTGKGRRLLYQDYMTEEWNPDGTLKNVSFKIPENFNFAFDVLDRLAAEAPDKVAMMWVSKDKKSRPFTFRDISEQSSRTANMLYSMGVRKGDRVMLVLKRHYQFWFILNALHKIGAVAVPASCQMTAHDFEYRFAKADIKFVICSADGDITREVDAAAAGSPGVRMKISVNGAKDGWFDFDAFYGKFPAEFARPADHKVSDPMLIFFSSGTTGYPKMVEHDYSYPVGHIMTARHWHKVNPEGLHFTVADTGWGKALWGKIYGQWFCEAGVFTFDFDRFHAADLLPMFKQYGITTFCAPPTIFRFLVKEDLSQYDFSTLEHVSTAGEAMPPEVSETFARASGRLPYEGFGQTESTLLIGTFADMKPRPGSMGKPNPQFHIELLNSEGAPVPMGDTGEICVKAEGPASHPCGLFCGYVSSQEDTAKAWHDGYYHTGDLAWRDEDGYFWYVGRGDDIIKTSGYRVGPFEIESVLMELPYIIECAVTGVPDPVRGKVIKATIVLTRDKTPSEELKKEIQNYVKTHTAPYKYPRVVDFVAELPKTVNGKIRRTAIRASRTEEEKDE